MDLGSNMISTEMYCTKEISTKTFIMGGESPKNFKGSTKKEENMAGECMRILIDMELRECIMKVSGKMTYFKELEL